LNPFSSTPEEAEEFEDEDVNLSESMDDPVPD